MMLSVRCPQCELPITDAEMATGTCPVCTTALVDPAASAAKTAPEPPPAPRKRSLLLLSSLAALLLLAGGAFGYYLGLQPA